MIQLLNKPVCRCSYYRTNCRHSASPNCHVLDRDIFLISLLRRRGDTAKKECIGLFVNNTKKTEVLVCTLRIEKVIIATKTSLVSGKRPAARLDKS